MRQRVGRGGRIWLDRSIHQLLKIRDVRKAAAPAAAAAEGADSAKMAWDPAAVVRSLRARIFGVARLRLTGSVYRHDQAVEDEGVWDDTVEPMRSDETVVPSNFLSVSLPCYTPQDLGVLNGVTEHYMRYVCTGTTNAGKKRTREKKERGKGDC